jgi:DNA-binding response OmpR family regulator
MALGSQQVDGARILVVDDETRVADLLRDWLEGAGYTVIAAYDGMEGLREFFSHKPDLAILDMLMPKMGGMELARRIREVSNIPVLMLSARGQEEDKVRALALGADDYMVKPIGGRELLARVAAALRRTGSSAESNAQETYRDDALTMDFTRHEVFVSGEPVNLTKLEYQLLACLVRQAGRVLTYDQLLDCAWGADYDSPQHVTWHIGRLRRKVEADPAHPHRIVTVRGVGYRYDRPQHLPS